jgi:FixJ family two-component response regulator
MQPFDSRKIHATARGRAKYVSLRAKPVVAVVDDDPGLLESLEDLLEPAGYGVRLFASAEQFLETAVMEVDCVVSDIGMPRTDGSTLQTSQTYVQLCR